MGARTSTSQTLLFSVPSGVAEQGGPQVTEGGPGPRVSRTQPACGHLAPGHQRHKCRGTKDSASSGSAPSGNHQPPSGASLGCYYLPAGLLGCVGQSDITARGKSLGAALGGSQARPGWLPWSHSTPVRPPGPQLLPISALLPAAGGSGSGRGLKKTPARPRGCCPGLRPF